MKIDKLNNINPQELKPLVDKINLIIDLITCDNCKRVKGVVGCGVCFTCHQNTKSNRSDL